MRGRIKLVSVIIPNYNKEKYIRQCIESVLSQTYTDLEVIVVDDVSTDSSRKIILEYAEKDYRVHPLFLEKNGGVSAARNAGILAAKGNYITMLDSDDFYFDKDKLHAEMELITKYGTSILAYSYRVLVDQNGIPLSNRKDERRYVSGEDMLYHFLTEKNANMYVQRDFIVRKDILVEVGMYKDKESYYEDYDLLLRLIKKCPLYYTGVFGTAYRIIDSGLSQTQKKNDARQFRIPMLIRRRYIVDIEDYRKRRKASIIWWNQMILTELKILRRKIYRRG